MRFARTIPALLILLLGLASGSLSVALAAGGAAVPADLQALVQRSEHLRVTGLVATGSQSASLNGKSGSLLSLTERVGTSPPQSDLTVDLSGQPSELRAIGGALYLRVAQTFLSAIPGLVKQFPGRDWLRVTRRELAGVKVPAPTAPPVLHPSAPNPVAPTGLGALVAITTGVVDAGPKVVGGQAVREFTGSVDSSRLFNHLHENLFLVPPHTSLNVLLDIAPNGLLKRAEISVSNRGVQEVLAGDVLSVSARVSVRAPAARDTIDASKLNKVQAADLGL